MNALAEQQHELITDLKTIQARLQDLPLLQQTISRDIVELRESYQIARLSTAEAQRTADGVGKSLDSLRNELENERLIRQARLRILYGVLSFLSAVLTAVVIALVMNVLNL
jgi:hypothetical protein